MCGRFANALGLDELKSHFIASLNAAATHQIDALRAAVNTREQHLAVRDDVPPPSTHIRPTTRIAVIATTDDGPTLTGARWGLIPHWAKEVSSRPLINARVETLLVKPSFRDVARKRRVVIPATGYYEWLTSDDGTKQPHLIANPGGAPLWMAGVASWWKDPSLPEPTSDDAPTNWKLTAAIVTTAAYPEVAWVHDRSPLMIPDDHLATWLDADLTDKNDVAHLLDTLPAAELHAEPCVLPASGTTNQGGTTSLF